MRVRFGCVLSLLLVACNDPGVSVDAGRDASAPGDDAGRDSGALDSGAPFDAGSDAGSDAGPARRVGVFGVLQRRGTGALSTAISGSFRETPGEVGSYQQPCDVVATQGACIAVSCVTEPTHVGAGTVTVSVEGTEIASLTGGTTGSSYLEFLPDLVFAPGDEVAFAASGDVVPAFSSTVIAPGEPTVTFPATAARTTALTIAFTASSEQVVLLLLARTDGVLCTTDAASGSMTVPPELLGMLPAGDTGITLTAYNQATVAAGDWDITLSAGDRYQGTIALE